MFFLGLKICMVVPEDAFFGCFDLIFVFDCYFVLGMFLMFLFFEYLQIVVVGMGCFWGVERVFW